MAKPTRRTSQKQGGSSQKQGGPSQPPDPAPEKYIGPSRVGNAPPPADKPDPDAAASPQAKPQPKPGPSQMPSANPEQAKREPAEEPAVDEEPAPAAPVREAKPPAAGGSSRSDAEGGSVFQPPPPQKRERTGKSKGKRRKKESKVAASGQVSLSTKLRSMNWKLAGPIMGALIGIPAVYLIGALLGWWALTAPYDYYQAREAREMMEDAHRLMDRRLQREAAVVAEKAYKMAPEDTEVLRSMAAFVDRGNFKDTLYFWKKLVAKEDSTVEDRIGLAKAILKDGDAKAFDEIVTAALKEAPDNAEVLKAARVRNLLQGDSEGADAMLERAAKADPNDPLTRYLTAKKETKSAFTEVSDNAWSTLWQLSRGQDDTALLAIRYLLSQEQIRGGSFDELIKLVRTHPGASEAHRLAALEAELKLYPSMKDEILLREAEERAAWPSVELSPFLEWLGKRGEGALVLRMISEEQAKSDPHLLLPYLVALMDEERWLQIDAILQEEDKLPRIKDPGRLELFRAQAAINLKKGTDDVRSLYRKAAQEALEKRNLALLINTGDTARRNEFFDVAEEIFRTARDVPDLREVSYPRLMSVLRQTGQTAKLIQTVDDAVEDYPGSEKYKLMKTYLALLHGESVETGYEEAKALFAEDPNSLDTSTIYAVACLRMHNPAEAEVAVANFEQLSPKSLMPQHRAVAAAVKRRTNPAEVHLFTEDLERDNLLPEEIALMEE